MFAWVEGHEILDEKEVIVWGFSTGGYHAIRLAHTHASQVKGVVSLGGRCHWMFDRRWLEGWEGREYPLP